MTRKLSRLEVGRLWKGTVVRLQGTTHIVRDAYMPSWDVARVRMLCEESFESVGDGEVEWGSSVTCNNCLLRELRQ